MTRFATGLAALSVVALTACGTIPGTAPAPAPVAPTDGATTTAPTGIPAATPSPTATPDGTASPTATATATPTATPTATVTPTAAAINLPERVESFTRVEQRSENDVRIASYYSDGLKTVIEVRAVRNRPARDLLTSLGATNPANVGPALCSSEGDTLCAQENNGVTVAVVSKELPATMVSNLTTQFLDTVT